MPETGETSMEEFKLMADRAGLGMSQEELDDLKPIYEIYAAYAQQLHTLSFGAEEMVVEFHPDWPEGMTGVCLAILDLPRKEAICPLPTHRSIS